MKIAVFDTDLTDDQWALLQPMLPQRSPLGRPPTDRRRITNAILYILKGGIPWRLLPTSFPPWRTVFHVFRLWQTGTRLEALWADGGYTGEDFAGAVREHLPNLEVKIIKRSDDTTGFKVLPRRWVVGRTFSWLTQHRRLARDYERTESSAEAWIYLAMIRVQLRRLA